MMPGSPGSARRGVSLGGRRSRVAMAAVRRGPGIGPMAVWRGRTVERRALERRRELEERRRQQWERTSRSLAQAAICCARQARWSAARDPPPRAEAAQREAEEAAERLEQRRERLRRLLGAEQEALEAELRRGPGVAEMRQQSEELQDSGEQRRRRVEPEPHKKPVVEAWGDQLTEETQQEAAELEEKTPHEKECETAREEALERLREEEEKRRLEGEKQAEMLLQRIEELKLQETKAAKLKEEQENLLKQHWELESLEEERKQMEEQRKKKELGRFLRHQCDIQLQRRAQQIQEELEVDRQILLALLEKEDKEQRRQPTHRERAVVGVAWMKRVIEEQLYLEKQREAELQMFFREEVKKVWEKREEEWEREKKARDRLMNEVLAGRQRQIQEKMELNRRAQEESIKYREQLIKELEEAKELRRQEEKQLKTARRQELEAQLTEQCSQEQQEEEVRSARQRSQELEQQDAERWYHSRLHSYPRAAWT